MGDTERPITRTTLDAAMTCAALKRAWHQQLGVTPEREHVLVVLAQIWHETNAGASCFNFNLAGVKHWPNDGRDFFTSRTTEVIGGVDTIVRAEFRAFADLDAGMADYFKELRTTFADAWPAILAGDTAAYAHALKLAHYYTASEANYAAALARHRDVLDAVLPPDSVPETPQWIVFGLPDPGHGDPPPESG